MEFEVFDNWRNGISTFDLWAKKKSKSTVVLIVTQVKEVLFDWYDSDSTEELINEWKQLHKNIRPKWQEFKKNEEKKLKWVDSELKLSNQRSLLSENLNTNVL